MFKAKNKPNFFY